MQRKRIGGRGRQWSAGRTLALLGVVAIVAAAAATAWTLTRRTPETELVALPERSTIPVISVEEVRAHSISEVDVGSPNGLAVAPNGDTFYLAQETDPTEIVALSQTDAAVSTITLPGKLVSPGSYTFDDVSNALIAWTGGGTLDRLQVDDGATTSLAVPEEDPAVFDHGVVFDRVNDVAHGLRGTELVTFHLPAGTDTIGRIVRRVDLAAALSGPGSGLAVDGSGRLFVADPDSGSVLHLDVDAQPVQIIDLAASGVGSILDIAVAATSDTSDPLSVSNLYVLDDTVEDSDQQRVIKELTMVPRRSSAIAGTVERAVLRTAVPLGDQRPPTPDASGVTWLPSRNGLLVSDSEIDEYDFGDGTNLREVGLDGTVVGATRTHAWSTEPSDLVFDAAGNRLFTTDDDQRRVFEIDAGPDRNPGTDDDIVRRSFDTTAVGSTDPEGIAYDAARGRLHIADGDNKEIFTIDPGPNGVFDGVAVDDLVEQFDTGSAGLRDPEGIAHHAENDTLVVVDQTGPLAIEFGPSGSVLRYIDLVVPDHDIRPAGVTWAPSSTGGGRSLWVVERGVDGPEVRDGMLYEFDVPPLGGGTPAPIIGVPAAVSFGPVGTGLTVRRELTLSNQGTSALEVSSVRISGPDADRFTVVRGAQPSTVPGGASIPVTVEFTPTEVRPYSSTLAVESNALGRPAVVVSLEGDGAVADPSIETSPRVLRFPTNNPGSPSPRTLTISNRGTAPLNISRIAVEGLTPSVFSVAAADRDGMSIPAGGSYNLMVVFSSPTAGAFSGVLTIVSDDDDRRTTEVPLTAEARSGAPQVGADAAVVGGSTRASTVSTDEPLDPAIGQLHLAFVTSKPALPIGSVFGMGTTWTPVRFQCGGRGQTAISVYVATGASEAGTVTATFGDAAISAAIAVVAYSGADLDAPIGSVVAANTNGRSGVCSGGVDSSSFAVSLPAGDTPSLVTGVAAIRNRELSPGARIISLLEHSAGTGGDAAGLAITARPSDGRSEVPMSGRFSGEIDWAFVAVEIRAAG